LVSEEHLEKELLLSQVSCESYCINFSTHHVELHLAWNEILSIFVRHFFLVNISDSPWNPRVFCSCESKL